MSVEPSIAIAISIPAVAVLVWLIRLEGRVNTNDVVVARLQTDVTYIRGRIDKAINGHSHSRRGDGGQDDDE